MEGPGGNHLVPRIVRGKDLEGGENGVGCGCVEEQRLRDGRHFRRAEALNPRRVAPGDRLLCAGSGACRKAGQQGKAKGRVRKFNGIVSRRAHAGSLARLHGSSSRISSESAVGFLSNL
jgi:hypothetical protein